MKRPSADRVGIHERIPEDRQLSVCRGDGITHLYTHIV